MKEEQSQVKPEGGERVIEKRVTGTIIRRRRKAVPSPPPPVDDVGTKIIAESSEKPDVVASGDDVNKTPAVDTAFNTVASSQVEVPSSDLENIVVGDEKNVAVSEDAKADSIVVDDNGPKLIAPSDVEKKIGVVGHIDLSSVEPRSAVKEDWREKLKKGGAKRKKSRAELEMEAIQRAGGLKHYVPDADAPERVAADRVFQPTHTSRRHKLVRRDYKQTRVTERKESKRVIRIEKGITVSALSQSLGIKASEIIKKLMSLDIMATINQAVDVETASLIAEEVGFKVEHVAFKEEEVLSVKEESAEEKDLVSRSPVVTIMGHVDHGKTSILDYIRKTKVASGEAGGITQHIGAYEVEMPSGSITFIDTPGHEAFTMMRSRGAQLTDIVILVVAADDGIMPQTIEAINHSKAAGVPIIVAINKMDKTNAQPDRVKQGLTEYELVPEEWGGDIICVPVSAKTGDGIDKLLEMVLLQAEMLDIKGCATMRAKGVVIESRLDRGRGPVATVLVQEGTLKVSDYVVCGISDGKIRAMFDHNGKSIKEAGLAKPVEVLGLSSAPTAGDDLIALEDEKAARMVAEQRKGKKREKSLGSDVRVSLEDLSARMSEEEAKKLLVIIKADTNGSVEAIRDSLEKLSTEKVEIKVLHAAVGGIVESDVMLANASNAIIIGFNVRPDNKAKSLAASEKIEIRMYRVIYEMLDEIKKAMEGLLSPDIHEIHMGTADVRQVFKVSKVGTIAGCKITSGKIIRGVNLRLLRDQVVVFEGKNSSLKRFKDDVKEVSEGMECGIGIENYNDIKVGDVIDAYTIEEKAATL